MLCIRLTLQLPSDARECTNKPSGFQAFIPKLGPDLDLLMGEMSRNRGMGGILLLALFYPLLHDLLLLDLLGLPRGVGLEESPASPRIYHCPTVCRDWYTNEIEQAAAHRRPESTGCATVAYPSASAIPASREGPSDPCLRSEPQRCSRASAMLCGTGVPVQDCALYTPEPATNALRPEYTKRIDPATSGRCARRAD